MCRAKNYLEGRLAVMLDGETVELSREQIEHLLEEGCSDDPVDPGGRPEGVSLREDDQLLYTPAQLGLRLGRSARTIKRWAAAGKFGPPEQLKDDSGRWQISRYHLDHFLRGPKSGDAVPESGGGRPAISSPSPPKSSTAKSARKRGGGSPRGGLSAWREHY
jgi:hypothetical protein